jgi:hypothetical protein
MVAQIGAPGGQHAAVLFQRDCGATTRFSTQVSIIGAGDGLSGAGNAYSADDGHGAAFIGSWGGPWTEMKWLAPDHILIRFDAKSRIFLQAVQVNGIRVTYEPVTHRPSA